MKIFKLFAAAAAALILSTPAFAQEHQHAAGSCPHHQATETAMTQALALLDQAGTQNGDQAKATVSQARRQLAEAQKHMAACEEMCEAKMEGGQEGHGAHGDLSGHNMTPGHPVHDHAPAAEGKTQPIIDPVCGMTVDPKTAAAKTVYAGKVYHFCSKDDKEKFDKDPEKYLKKQG